MGPCWFLVCITENKGNEYWSINNDFDFSFFVSKSGWPTVKQAQFKVYRNLDLMQRCIKMPKYPIFQNWSLKETLYREKTLKSF